MPNYVPRNAALRLQNPAMIKRGDFEHFPKYHDWRDSWIPYPRQAEPLSAHTDCVMDSMFTLAIILRDVSGFLFREAKPAYPNFTNVDKLYQRLRQWSQTLAECITEENISLPAVMEMQ
jgi:hypothetical protein